MQPKLTVSGYRGVWGSTLTVDIVRNYVRAYAMFVLAHSNGQQPTILVGRDGRESGPEIVKTVTEELLVNGINVIDLSMVATPIAVFLVRSEKTDGAVVVTASHNPIEYNGIKFVTKSGAFTTESEVAEIESFRGKEPELTTYGSHENGEALFEKYFDQLLSNIDVASIQSQNFKVAIDPINSVGCTTTPRFLKSLGAEVFAINSEPTGKFAHEPEPIVKNLISLSMLVCDKGCDVGFAQDPDGDRLVICDENGVIPTEETMLALALKAILAKTPGDIAINLSTSNMSEDIAKNAGGKTWRSKVGEANVLKTMTENKAVAGGEGSGGVIWPKVNAARDSYVGMGLILELMAKEQKPLSEMIAALPKYFMEKEKVSFTGDIPTLYEKMKTTFPDGTANTLDGLRIDFPDRSWIHVRPSNTEPVIRIIAEATTAEKAIELVQKSRPQ